MSRLPRLFVFLALFVAAAVASSSADQVKQELAAAVCAVRPAVVRIHVVSADFRQGRELKSESYGSGVIVSPQGYVVTNAHVTMDAEHIVCTLADKREVDAKLVGMDPLADIAVIKLVQVDGKPFAYAKFGDSSKLSVGDRVYSMGCPLAISQSVTAGMVSNTEMIMPAYFREDDFQLEGENVGSVVRWIGHDALIEPGNSGGPLVAGDGCIVGINEISLGLSGAIPSNLAKEVTDQLIKNSKVTRAWLGLDVQPLLESSKVKSGILVGGVLDESPAKKAGFQSGDIIVSLAGKAVNAKFDEEIPLFNQFAACLPVGKPVSASVLRAGKEITVSITPEPRQKAQDRQYEIKNWGVCGTNITYLMRKEMRLTSQDGVIVTGVLPSGPAGSAKPPLREGDVIVDVGGQAVKDVHGLRSLTDQITAGKTEPVPTIVTALRKQERFATVVKIGKREPFKPSSEISKAWLPINNQVLTSDLAEALGVDGSTGVRVTQVYDKACGLQVGDLILKLDGESIPADQMGDEEVLPEMIRQYDVGVEVKLGIVRGGKPTDLNVKLSTSPKPTRDYPKFEEEDFEFTARDITFSDRADGSVPQDQAGAYVESVADGSWAALGGLSAGDVVMTIDGSAVKGLDDLKSAMSAIGQKKPKAVVFKVRRGIHTLYLEFEPMWSS